MAFIARDFVFDDIPSNKWEIFVVANDMGGVVQSNGSGSVELYTEKIYRRPKPFLYGTQQTPVLEFNLSFACLENICAEKQMLIQKWLFGHNEYKKLRIIQPDYQEVYFNCILTEPYFNCVGNFPFGMTCKVICDSPFAWEEPHSIRFDNVQTQVTGRINNISDLNDYVLPLIEFRTSPLVGNSFEIINNSLLTGNGTPEKFTMTGLKLGETIKINSDYGIVKSSTDLLRYQNVARNSRFFRLKPFYNDIVINGNFDYVKITYQNARRVSG